ncbi:MAG: MaoC family dehydratase N-terminal domain-containing protein [Chloroflexota bacterium]|nr:MaoC family dehydratase N-terminal domain-containing protein [Chloroflexota bacterium]
MAEESVVTDEMRAAIGTQSEPTVIEIEKGMIRKHAEAVEDPNPLWQDGEYARRARYGGMVASPGLLTCVMMMGERVQLPFQLPFLRVLDGGGEWEFFQPIRPGDVLTVTNKLVNLRERTGKSGKMVFTITETTWKNQRDEVVARAQGTIIMY